MITTNYGALFETCSEWPVYVKYTLNYKNMSECFAYAIDSVQIIYITIKYKTFKCNKNFIKSFILGIKKLWNGKLFTRSFECKIMNQYGLTNYEKEITNNFKDIQLFVGTPVHSDVSIHYTQSVLELQKDC